MACSCIYVCAYRFGKASLVYLVTTTAVSLPVADIFVVACSHAKPSCRVLSSLPAYRATSCAAWETPTCCAAGLTRHMLLCCSGPGYCRVCAWLHVPVRTHQCVCTPCTNLSGTTAFIGSVAGPVCFWCGCWCAGKEVSCWEASGAPGKVHKLLSKAHVHLVRLHCC